MKEILLIFFSILGFFVSYHIWNTSTRKKRKLVCPINDENCDKVVKSKYSKTLGFDNSFLGMIYYVSIFLVGIFLLFSQTMFNVVYFNYALIAITGISVIFSAFLFFIEIFVIKKICTYCTLSGILTLLIFLAVIFL